MQEINIWYVFEPNFREIYRFGKNNVFFSAILGSFSVMVAWING